MLIKPWTKRSTAFKMLFFVPGISQNEYKFQQFFNRRQQMFIDTDETRRLRQKYNVQMQNSGIKTFQDMDKIEMGALESGALSQKYKELIALGISITKACYG